MLLFEVPLALWLIVKGVVAPARFAPPLNRSVRLLRGS
jgi:hypothetical protein